MATIGRDKGGKKRILIVCTDKKRRPIRLGKATMETAESFCGFVERLKSAKLCGGTPAPEDAARLGKLSDYIHEQVVKCGLAEPRIKPETATEDTLLAAFLDAYVARRMDAKPATRTNWGHTVRCLKAFFGDRRTLESITAGDARDFQRWSATPAARENRYGETDADSGLAPNTLRKRISNAKQFFQDAVDRELISRNPFQGLKGSVGANRARDHFVDLATAARVLDACPTLEWKLLFALARFQGMRIPSEALALQWSDIDWQRDRMTIHASKTEHHEGGGVRVMPIFPETRALLEEAMIAPEGGEYVITRTRDATVNLRTTLQKIIRKAGAAPWPKLWQNLRASRATELAAAFPSHVAAAWLGHTEVIANKHYRQVTDSDFARAAKLASVPRGTESGTVVAQIAAHQTPTPIHTVKQETKQALGNQGLVSNAANSCESFAIESMGVTGFEPVTSTV